MYRVQSIGAGFWVFACKGIGMTICYVIAFLLITGYFESLAQKQGKRASEDFRERMIWKEAETVLAELQAKESTKDIAPSCH